MRMVAMMRPMKNNWKRLTQRCQATGRNLWKSTLQNVTKSTRNINIGRMVSKTGPKNSDAESNWGVKAKNR